MTHSIPSGGEGDPTAASEEARSHLSSEESTALVDSVQTWRYSVDARQYGFFLAKKVRTGDEIDAEDQPPPTPTTPASQLGFKWMITGLAGFESGFFKDCPAEDRFICFADPSTYPQYPGWMLRNLLVLIRQRWKLSSAQILCYRDIPSRRHEARSIILSLILGSPAGTDDGPIPASNTMPKVTGWERNAAGKTVSQIRNLGEYMDPKR